MQGPSSSAASAQNTKQYMYLVLKDQNDKDLLEFMGQFLGVQLHRRQRFLVLGQVENLNGVRKHRTHLLFFVRGVFPCLRVNTMKSKVKCYIFIVTVGESVDKREVENRKEHERPQQVSLG